MAKYTYFLFSFLLIISCSNDVAMVDAITESYNVNMENGSNIKMLYSDSAVVKVRITADSIVRFVDKSNPRDAFPSGIFIEFLSPSGKPNSWLEADNAIRNEKENTFTAIGNVRLYNKKEEKLLTTELIWDEDKSKLYTEKFVTIIQPEKGDTTYGIGFESNEEFNIFEIKRRTSAIFQSDSFKKNFKN